MRLLVSIFSCFALVAAAAPVDQASLNSDNFKDTISKGVWFIEHFSPYCHHCRDFASTWMKLVEETEQSSDPGIHLAQVNCATYGDLCSTNNIKGYPQLNIYRDGEFVEMFNGDRELDPLREFMSKHAQPTSTSVAPAPSMPVLHVQTSRVEVNPSGSVIPLGDNNFDEVVNQGPVFVKFFAPWCGHCKKLAPTWSQLARHMRDKLNIAEVNCEEQASLCKSQDIQGYPMLFYYSNGIKTEYTGSRKLDQLKEFTDKASAPTIQELKTDEFEQHVRDHDVLYLLLHDDSSKQVMTTVTQASTALLGTPPVFSTSSSEVFEKFSIKPATAPTILVFKDHDASTPAAMHHVSDAASLQNWLIRNRLPTITELNQDTFQGVMKASHQPLVVISAVSKDNKAKVSGKMNEIGKKWKLRKTNNRERDVIFAWMDADKWASWLKSMYGIRDDEGIVISDHGRLVYYDQDASDQPLKLTSTSLFPAIEGVQRGTIKAKHSENVMERLVRYLNEQMISLESYVVNHPYHIVFFLVAFAVLIFVAIRRALADDYEQSRGNGNIRKTHRLD